MQTSAPSSSLTDAQITDLSHFIWQRINDTLRGSAAFDAGDVLVGDGKAGEAYFNGEGRCATCHSPTGDLAGYGKRFPPVDIQQRFVFPNTAGGRGRGRAAGPSRQQVTATVTLPDGTTAAGTLVSIDDFHVALRDSTGAFRSFPRTAAMKIVRNDPLAAHVELLDRLTDKQMHDVVAYLGVAEMRGVSTPNFRLPTPKLESLARAGRKSKQPAGAASSTRTLERLPLGVGSWELGVVSWRPLRRRRPDSTARLDTARLLKPGTEHGRPSTATTPAAGSARSPGSPTRTSTN